MLWIELCAYDFFQKMNMNTPTRLLKRATKPVVALYIYGMAWTTFNRIKFSQSLKTASISQNSRKLYLIYTNYEVHDNCYCTLWVHFSKIAKKSWTKLFLCFIFYVRLSFWWLLLDKRYSNIEILKCHKIRLKIIADLILDSKNFGFQKPLTWEI